MKVSINNIFLLLLFINFSIPGKSQNWLTNEGGSSNDEALDITVDSSGNYYVTGYFTGKVEFGKKSMTSYGNSDIFIAKYDVNGVLQWAIQAGGANADRAYSIKVDTLGFVYITGFYYGTATFGSSSISSISNTQDVFVAKYSINGNFLWVKSIGGTEAEIGNGITFDGNENVIVTGQFKGAASFGGIVLNSAKYIDTAGLPGLPSFDIFTTKLDKSGNFLWAKKGSAIFDDRGIDVAVDKANNIFVVGQFSDTITFDNTYNNQTRNAGFLLKYDENGNELFFIKMSARQTLVNSIDIDKNDNVFITGDYIGNLQIFTNPPVIKTSNYFYNIFIAKYSNTGSLLWVDSDGSSNEVTSKSITLDKGGNPYIAGLFKCRFDEYSEQYDEGIFYSSGFRDVFVSKYSGTGTREWFKHFGSNEDDFCSGIALHVENKPAIAGSFENQFNIPYSEAFTPLDSIQFQSHRDSSFCSIKNYQKFVVGRTRGQKDIFICSPIDISPDQPPFDYFKRGLQGCMRNFLAPCIEDCEGTLHSCGQLSNMHANTHQIGQGDIGAIYDYTWSVGGNRDTSGVITSTNNYWLKSERKDHCFQNIDTVAVLIHPIPDDPWITDSYSINVNRPPKTTEIKICGIDTITLSGTHTTIADTISWDSDTDFLSLNDSTIVIDESGTFHFSLITKNGCTSYNDISVFMDDFAIHDVLDPHIVFTDPILEATDTITICYGDKINAMVIDSAFYAINKNQIPYKTVNWKITSPGLFYKLDSLGKFDTTSTDITYQFHSTKILITKTGDYTLYDTLINACGDSVIYPLTRTFHVIVQPRPATNLKIIGPKDACPDDTLTLVGLSNMTELYWEGPNIIENYYDSIKVKVDQKYDKIYLLSGKFVDTITGCSDSAKTNFIVHPRSSPRITMNPVDGIICPDDSIQIKSDSGANYLWIGPAGANFGTSQSIYTETPGYYYSIQTSDDGCVQLSNFVEAKLYSTPYLEVFPNTNICPDSSATIFVQASFLSIPVWESPLSGSSFSQSVSAPGIYKCSVTQCGITSTASMQITQTVVPSIITALDTIVCPGDTLVLNGNLGMIEYNWVGENKSDPFLYVTQPGTYILQTSHPDGCIGASTPYIVGTRDPIPPPTANDVWICRGLSAAIEAYSSDSIFWYYEMADTIPFFKGDVYSTPPILQPTTFYVQTFANPKYANCGSERAAVHVNNYMETLSVSADKNPIPDGESTHLNAKTDPRNTVYWTPADQVSDPTSTSPTVSPNEKTTYTVTILDKEGCPVVKEITIEVLPMNCAVSDIFIPNTFTPNNDNSNDILYVRGNEIDELYFAVYNRWGEMVFETSDIKKGWDGIYKDKKADPAVFHWYLRAKCYNGSPIEKKGNVTLVR